MQIFIFSCTRNGRTDKERSGVAWLHEGSFRCVGRWLQSPPQTAMLQAMASAWWINAEKGQGAWNPRTWVQLSHFRVQSFEAFISKTGLTLLCLYMVAIHINPDETAQAKLWKRAWMAATILKVPLVVVTVIGCSRFVALRVLTLAASIPVLQGISLHVVEIVLQAIHCWHLAKASLRALHWDKILINNLLCVMFTHWWC